MPAKKWVVFERCPSIQAHSAAPFEFDDVLLRDRVADNLTFRDLTESETLLIGRNFGVVTDIEPSPRGTLFVVSLDQGAIYEISRAGREGDDDDRSGGDSEPSR